MAEQINVHESSGNVFADLGLPDAEERYARALISRRIANAIAVRGLTDAQAAQLLKTTESTVASVVRGRLAGLSRDRLHGFLADLGPADA